MIKKLMIKVFLLVGAVYCAGTLAHLTECSSHDPDKAVENFLSGKSDVLGGVDIL